MSDTPRTDTLLPWNGGQSHGTYKAVIELCRTLERELARVQSWIPITDRVPEARARVLVFDADKLFPWVGECEYIPLGDIHQFYEPGSDGDRRYHVTHWMPLPAAVNS